MLAWARRGSCLIGLAAAASLVLSAPASADVPSAPDTCSTEGVCVNTLVAAPGTFAVGFANPTVYIKSGSDLTFDNEDFSDHEIVSTSVDQNGVPLFSGPLNDGPGATTTVNGVSSLAPGTYSFYCVIHPFTMQGTLVVETP